jgi:hypothetical protein
MDRDIPECLPKGAETRHSGSFAQAVPDAFSVIGSDPKGRSEPADVGGRGSSMPVGPHREGAGHEVQEGGGEAHPDGARSRPPRRTEGTDSLRAASGGPCAWPEPAASGRHRSHDGRRSQGDLPVRTVVAAEPDRLGRRNGPRQVDGVRPEEAQGEEREGPPKHGRNRAVGAAERQAESVARIGYEAGHTTGGVPGLVPAPLPPYAS